MSEGDSQVGLHGVFRGSAMLLEQGVVSLSSFRKSMGQLSELQALRGVGSGR